MIAEAFERAVTYLKGRTTAYRLVFSLNNPADQMVLADLAKFCRAMESTAIPGDHDRTWALIGRREVWLRITQHLSLTPEQLAQLYIQEK